MKDGNLALNFAYYVSKVVPVSFKKYLYKSPTLSNLIRRSLNQFAPEGINRVSIAAGINEDLEMFLDLQTEKDYWLGTYEPELQQTIELLVKPEQVVYDIGANIGFVTLMFARQTGEMGHVYAFEALPENVIRLRQNVDLNGYLERVTVVNAAVQDRAGEAEFLMGPSGAMGKVKGSAGRDTIEYLEYIKVKAISIDGFIENSGNLLPDIVKMDIEGGEILALPGMSNLLQTRHPLVMIELHGLESAEASWQLLRNAGYRICRMELEFPQVGNIEELDWKSYLVAFPYEY